MCKSVLNWLALLAVCISCKQSPERGSVLRSLRQSLEKSSRMIGTMSETTIMRLREKRQTPATSYKGEIWLSKAEQADKYKKQLIQEIDRIVKVCESNAGVCKEPDLLTLKNRLKEYADSTMAIDSLIKYEFARNFTDSVDSEQSLFSIWSKLNDADNKDERVALFAQLRLSAIQNTNDVILFCSEQVPVTHYYSVYSAIVAQNSNAILPGEQLEIIAGVGSFSRAAQPQVLIDSKPCDLREDATFRYQITPKGKPGIYSIPVVMDFMDEDGKPVQISKSITFRLLPGSTKK